jgi:hypothetical protein
VEAPHFEKLETKKITNYLKKRNFKVIYNNTLNIIFKKL